MDNLKCINIIAIHWEFVVGNSQKSKITIIIQNHKVFQAWLAIGSIIIIIIQTI